MHVYTSMIAFVVILFFGITGITLNHPSWTFGGAGSITSETGTLPSGWNSDPVDFLAVTEYVRTTYGVGAPVSSYSNTPGEGTISFRSPGYGADLFFSTTDGSFELNIEQAGFLGVMNDLHKGRDSNSAWKWLIDVSGGFLVVVALTGLGIQLLLRKRRTRAVTFAVAGLALTIVFIVLTT
ncbi:MAG: PepSY-associated TM helix domain-containing protein [Ilumatobacteraceae bacterium]